jgi:hypothetical protein
LRKEGDRTLEAQEVLVWAGRDGWQVQDLFKLETATALQKTSRRDHYTIPCFGGYSVRPKIYLATTTLLRLMSRTLPNEVIIWSRAMANIWVEVAVH